MLLDWKPCSISCSLYIFASVSTRWRCYWIGNLNIKPVQNDLNEIVFASPLAGDVLLDWKLPADLAAFLPPH
jgi:hypothetical protein